MERLDSAASNGNDAKLMGGTGLFFWIFDFYLLGRPGKRIGLPACGLRPRCTPSGLAGVREKESHLLPQ